VASGCLVLVDGWNHFLAAQACFGYEAAVKFPIDRLARHVAHEVGETTLTGVMVVMAIPDRNQPGEEPEFWAWRKRLNKLRNYGVHHERARFSYQDTLCLNCRTPMERKIKCPKCEHLNSLAGRRKEKGADIKLAALALEGAWRSEYSTLVIASKDSDFGPLVKQLKDIHKRQSRFYNLYSAFPVCNGSGHTHYKVPGTKELRLDAATYAQITAQPFTAISQEKSTATLAFPDTRP
jgi:NYN domain